MERSVKLTIIIGIIGSVLLLVLSIFYYYSIYLPEQDQIRLQQQAMWQRDNYSAVILLHIGDEIVGDRFKIKINYVTESRTLSGTSGLIAADPGIKFIIAYISITNITNKPINFTTDTIFRLLDNKGKSYLSYPNTLSTNLSGKSLPTQADVAGTIVYRVSTDVISYYLITEKGSTKQLLKFKLK